MINLYPPNQLYFNNQIPTYKSSYTEAPNELPFSDSHYTIGGFGYNQPQSSPYNNGGYYNGLYNNLYNPYEERRRQEQYEKQRRAEYDNNRRIERLNLQRIYAYRGEELTDQEADRIIDNNINGYDRNNENPELEEFAQKLAILQNYSAPIKEGYSCDPELIAMSEAMNKCATINDAASESIDDYLDLVTKKLNDHAMMEYRKSNSNMQSMYNSNDYNELLSFHTSQSFMNDNIDISDMSVQLPSRLKNSYNDRRNAFLNALMGESR